MHTAIRKKTHFQISWKHFCKTTFFHKILEEFLKRKKKESDLEILPGKGGESLGQAQKSSLS